MESSPAAGLDSRVFNCSFGPSVNSKSRADTTRLCLAGSLLTTHLFHNLDGLMFNFLYICFSSNPLSQVLIQDFRSCKDKINFFQAFAQSLDMLGRNCQGCFAGSYCLPLDTRTTRREWRSRQYSSTRTKSSNRPYSKRCHRQRL